MSEKPANKGTYTVSATLLKLLYGKKNEVEKPVIQKVINNTIADNFLNSQTKKTTEKEIKPGVTAKKHETDKKTKYWFDSNWKDGVRVIGNTSYHYRSSWEANYARYLEMLRLKGVIKKWEHEPELFTFPKVKRGLKSYLPDFKVTYNDGRIEYFEVKGHMDSKAKTKLKRFIENYPHLTIKVIDKKWFDEFKSRGIKIEGWES